MDGLEQYLHQCGLEESLLPRIRLRTSQIHGCAYCLDMHGKDLRAIGGKRAAVVFVGRVARMPLPHRSRRAALAGTEAVTLIPHGHVPGALYVRVRPHFSEKELANLTLAVATINAWNRLSIAARIVPGAYRPVKTHERKTGTEQDCF